MTKSKLEVYIQILKEVALHEEVGVAKVAIYTKIAVDVVERSLGFMLSQGLIEPNSKDSYRIARRGLAVLKHFGVLEMQPQAIEKLLATFCRQ